MVKSRKNRAPDKEQDDDNHHDLQIDSHQRDDDESDDDDGDESDTENCDTDDDKQDGSDNDEENDEDFNVDDPANKTKRKIHKLSLTKTKDFNETLRKRGVIYMSRVPPRMNPAKVKQLLEGFGVVTRVFLVEEDATVRKRRRKTGHSGAKRYVEGWIEFEKKKIAKHVAASLNNTEISNHKRNVHYGDLWNLKYLSKFKWEHLTEKVAYERRVREQKLRVELMQARRENAAYTKLVETGKKLDKIEDRKRKRGETDGVESEQQRRKGPRQVKPVDAADKATKRALLKSLV
jgi:ESF2/ABP1 family protein